MRWWPKKLQRSGMGTSERTLGDLEGVFKVVMVVVVMASAK